MAFQSTAVLCDDASKKVEQQHKSGWFQFMKSVATFKGDLASLSAPPFLLLLVAPAKEENAEKRALLVMHWYLAGLKRQMATRNEDGSRKKLKPLNPFLGEIFLDRFDENHVFTVAKVHVEGIVSFQIAPELSGTSYIHSSSGYTTKIEYCSKGWLRGAGHTFKATLFRDGAEKSPLYTATGQWDGSYTVTNDKGRVIDTVDLASLKRTPLQVAPVQKQHPLETGRAWQHVIEAIHSNDMFAIGHEKSKIENAQRALRKEEAQEGRVWERRFFTSIQKDHTVDSLALRSKHDACHDYHVYWKFDHSKHDRIRENQLHGMKSPTHARFDSGIGMLPDDVLMEH
ncbi:hypothetical protein TruAng_003794 [Truncatella angustata]|nr:hypothetical protein TruAng_003794 [Truncatella angustata]